MCKPPNPLQAVQRCAHPPNPLQVVHRPKPLPVVLAPSRPSASRERVHGCTYRPPHSPHDHQPATLAARRARLSHFVHCLTMYRLSRSLHILTAACLHLHMFPLVPTFQSSSLLHSTNQVWRYGLLLHSWAICKWAWFLLRICSLQ